MFGTIKTLALSAFIGLGTLAAVPATAQADGIYLNFGDNGHTRFGVYTGERVHYRHHRRHEGRCSARHALNKADRMGIHRARIVNANRHTIKVRGRKYGGKVTVRFANERGCPIIYR